MDTFCQTFINKFHSIDIKLPHRDETVDTGLLFYLNSREKILKSFDFNTQKIERYNVPALPTYDKSHGVQLQLLDCNTLFISGGINNGDYIAKNCYTFNI